MAGEVNFPIDVEYLQGIHLVDSILWLDSPRKTDLCFLSHAHVNPEGPFKKILMTPATAALLGRKVKKNQTLLCPYRRRFSLGELDLTLYPAGHMLGSAQILIRSEKCSLVYTGDFRLGQSRTSETADLLKTDVLVLKTQYGLTHQVFPPRQLVENQIIDWIKKTQKNSTHPVFLVSAMGKAQELCHLLESHHISVSAHSSIYNVCRIYRKFGVKLTNVKRLKFPLVESEVVLLPFSTSSPKSVQKIKKLKTAIVSGKASDEKAIRELQVDKAFALSGHADVAGLMNYVRGSSAKKIFLVGRQSQAFARRLRKQGYNAWTLRSPDQLDFFIKP